MELKDLTNSKLSEEIQRILIAMALDRAIRNSSLRPYFNEAIFPSRWPSSQDFQPVAGMYYGPMEYEPLKVRMLNEAGFLKTDQEDGQNPHFGDVLGPI